MTEKLKPCPFCGGKAELCYAPGLGTDSCRGYTLQASCNECGATSPGLWQEKKPEPNDQLWKDAADEWNHRPGETAETCGIAYCAHYPEGLPVCAKCREASALAHDRACAELADARAEIERLTLEIENKQYTIMCAAQEIADLRELLEFQSPRPFGRGKDEV
jgi:rRNA maturation protein Nop10